MQTSEVPEIFGVVTRDPARQTPFMLRGSFLCILWLLRRPHGQGTECGELRGVSYMDVVQISAECILLCAARVVCNLNPGLILSGVVVDVEV
jgi:hypothetical protein